MMLAAQDIGQSDLVNVGLIKTEGLVAARSTDHTSSLYLCTYFLCLTKAWAAFMIYLKTPSDESGVH